MKRIFLLLLVVLLLPTASWAKKHHAAPPTDTPTATPTNSPTSTPTPIPYTGPKLFAFDAMWGAKGPGPDQLNAPEGVAIDPDGRILIADTGNNRVVIWDKDGKPVTSYGTFGSSADWRNPPQFNHPGGIYADPSRKIFVADTQNHRVVVLDEKGLVLSSWGTQGNDKAQFNLPRAIAKDHFGKIWVLDTGNSRVQVFSALGEFSSMWGAFGDPTSNTNT
ncbi:MAG TPA: NHL repeat-containing protein, partial [bacterium]|nr:NHL repeat-containing protein [bacterium]